MKGGTRNQVVTSGNGYRIFVLIFAICLTVGAGEKDAYKVKQDCLNKLSVSDKEFREAKAMGYQNVRPEVECLFECYAEGMGFLKNGIVSENELIDYVARQNNLLSADTVKIVVHRCMPEFNKQQTDNCKRYYQFNQCLRKNFDPSQAPKPTTYLVRDFCLRQNKIDKNQLVAASYMQYQNAPSNVQCTYDCFASGMGFYKGNDIIDKELAKYIQMENKGLTLDSIMKMIAACKPHFTSSKGSRCERYYAFYQCVKYRVFDTPTRSSSSSKKDAYSIKKKCLQRLAISDNEYRSSKVVDFRNASPKIECLFDCFARDMGFYKSNKINEDELSKYIEDENDVLSKPVIIKLIRECNPAFENTQSNQCKKYYNFNQCLKYKLNPKLQPLPVANAVLNKPQPTKPPVVPAATAVPQNVNKNDDGDDNEEDDNDSTDNSSNTNAPAPVTQNANAANANAANANAANAANANAANANAANANAANANAANANAANANAANANAANANAANANAANANGPQNQAHPGAKKPGTRKPNANGPNANGPNANKHNAVNSQNANRPTAAAIMMPQII